MLFAILQGTDFLIIAAIMIVVAGSGATTTAFRKAGGADLRRLEDKIDLILTHLNLEYVAPSGSEWKKLASQPGMKIAAIKAYREATNANLFDAKDAVEAYMTSLPQA